MQTAIDFVFLWCDGSDPDFIRQKAQRMKEGSTGSDH